MPEETYNYGRDAYSDALDTIDNFIDEIVEMLGDKGEASDDLMNDYPNGDSYHHEYHTDRSYTLIEAAHLLSQLRDNEETDSGLWEGARDPENAIEIKAAYTYGNEVMDRWNNLIEDLNKEFADIEVRRGPKEWRPGRKTIPSIKKFVEDWIKQKRKSV